MLGALQKRFVAWVCLCYSLLPGLLAVHITDSIRDADELQSGYVGGDNGMDPAVVGGPTFGNLWTTNLANGEQFYAKLLTYTPLPSIDTLQQTVIAMSTLNNVYILNATTGVVLRQANFGVPYQASDASCTDISPNVGITGTPVIDPATGIVYFWTKTYDAPSTGFSDGINSNGKYKFWAIDASTLAVQPGYPKDPQGTPADNNPNIHFNGGIQLQRTALILKNGVVYAGFGGNCDSRTYYGYLVGYRISDGSLAAVWTPEAGPQYGIGGGIWQAGGGISSDGKNLFIAVGNGNGHELANNVIRVATNPPQTLGESVVKLQINSDGTLTASQFFTPSDYQNLDAGDKDFGSTHFSLLDPATFKTSTVSAMGFCAGKGAEAYFLDSNNLGGFRTGKGGSNGVLQEFSLSNAVFSAVGSFPLEGGYVYITPVNGNTTAYAFTSVNGQPSFTIAGITSEKAAGRPGTGPMTSTSLQGQAGTGILWISDVDTGVLRIYSAVPQNGILKTLRVIAGAANKYQRPVFGDKKVFVPIAAGVSAFGAPVNLPVTCNTLDYGAQTVGKTVNMTMTCTANLPITINAINTTNLVFTPDSSTVKSLVGSQYSAGAAFSLPVSFSPVYKKIDPNTKVSYGITTPGAVAASIQFFTSNGPVAEQYANTAPITVKGVAVSQNPFLSITPNNVNLGGVVLNSDGQNDDGDILSTEIILSNVGQSNMTILGYAYAVIDTENDDDSPSMINYTTSPFADGDWIVSGLPKIGDGVAPSQRVPVKFTLQPDEAAQYQIQFYFYTNGGNSQAGFSGSANTAPIAQLAIQQWNSSGVLVANATSMDFGILSADGSTSRTLQMSVKNVGQSVLTITKSKPPGAGIISQIGNALPEGDTLANSDTHTATLAFSAPVLPLNVFNQTYTTQWVLNTDDLTFGVHDITMFGTATSRQVGPLLKNGTSQYRYLGCFLNGNQQTIATSSRLTNLTSMDNSMCQSFCYGKGYAYAATNYMYECFCAPTISSTALNNIVADQLCDYQCVGDITQACGGDGQQVSLFADTTRVPTDASGQLVADDQGASGRGGVPKQIAVGSLVYNSLGCYNDASAKMTQFSTSSGSVNQTLESCVQTCASKSYQFAGVEYGQECRCGNVLPDGNTPVSQTDCSMACTGNPNEPCGAGNRINLYQLAITQASTSNTAPGASTSTGSTKTTSVVQNMTNPSQMMTMTSATTISASTSASNLSVSTSASITTIPSQSPQSTGWTSLGCFNDTVGMRALLDASMFSSTITVESCQTFCLTSGFVYSGVEYSQECYCGSIISNGAVSGSPMCTMACSGAPDEICGGANALTLSKYTGTLVAPAANVLGYTSLGCYAEPAGSRLIGNAVFTDVRNMTIENCITTCANNNMAIAGLEYAQECFCASSLPSTAAIASGCNMACTGNKNENCGGPNRLNIYALAASSSTTTTSTYSSTITSSTSSSMSAASTTSVPNSSSFTSSNTAMTSNAPTSSLNSTNTMITTTMSTPSTTSSLMSSSTSRSSSTSTTSTTTSTASPFSTTTSSSTTSSTLRAITTTTSSSTANAVAPSVTTPGATTSSTTTSSTTTSSTTTSSTTTSSTTTSSTTTSSTTPSSTTTSSTTTSRTTSSSATTSSPATSMTSITTSKTSISSSTLSTLTTSSGATSTPDPWISQGCYQDNSVNRNLNAASMTDSAMTIQKCTAYCASSGQPYAGLEIGTQCFCGSVLTPTSSTACTTVCPGDSSKSSICGGSKALSVYYNSAIGNPPFINSPRAQNTLRQNYTAAGCFRDASNHYLNAAVSRGNSSMTLQSCVDFCSARGYPLAGAEYGNECYCGSSFPNGTISLLNPDACGKPCAGRSSTTCGGSNFAMNIYNATVFY